MNNFRLGDIQLSYFTGDILFHRTFKGFNTMMINYTTARLV